MKAPLRKKGRGGNRVGAALVLLVALIMLGFVVVNALDMVQIENFPPEAVDTVWLDSGSVFRQALPDARGKLLEAVNISFNIAERDYAGTVRVDLWENENVIASWEVDSGDIENNALRRFFLDAPYQCDRESDYAFTVTETYEGDNAVAIWYDDEAGNGFSVDGAARETGRAYYTLTYRHDALVHRIILLAVAAAAALVALYFLKVGDVALMALVLLILMAGYIAVGPNGTAPDEEWHFYRVYELAQGKMITPHIEAMDGQGGDVLPEAVRHFKESDAVIDWDDTTTVLFPGTASYSIFSYLPQVIGVKVASLFTNSVRGIFYGGRVGNALCALLLCAWALAITPVGRKPFFVVMAFPMTLQEICSVSPDGFTIPLSFLFLAYILRLAYRAEKVTVKDMVILAVVGFLLTMSKTVYIVLLLLLFLIPAAKFSGKKTALVCRCAFIAVTAIITALWFRLSTSYWAPHIETVNSGEQVKYLLTHVKQWILLPVKTILAYGLFWAHTMVGHYMGAINIVTTPVMWQAFSVLFVYELCSSSSQGLEVSAKDVLLLLATVFGGAALVGLAMYISWTAVGDPLVEGIQGRYFTPLMGALSVAVIFGRKLAAPTEREESPRSPYLLILTLGLNGLALVDLVKNYLAR